MVTRYLNCIRYCLLLIILLGFVHNASSQETGSCAEKLKSGQSLFDKGQVEQVPLMLQACMRVGFTCEESLSAYKLLIQSYLFEEKLDMADSTMMEFLRKNPEYELSPTDHPSFVSLFNNFRVKPMIKLSLHFGTNAPFLTSVVPSEIASEPGNNDFNPVLANLYASLEAKYEITSWLEASLEAGYSQMSFTKTIDFMDIGTTTYNEIQKRIELPLSLTYNFRSSGSFTPYARIGFGPALMIGVTSTAEFIPVDQNGDSHTGSDIDRKASRINIDPFVQAGAGLKFKTRGGFLFAELRSNIGLRNQVVHKGFTPEEQELNFFYFYKDDESFHLNAVNISLGYTQIFYKPSKRK